ncbi:MAG: hypothetical protein U0974_09125 [Gemmatimonadales bacterium]|nr:hypothetical protein [Gemmatimonadales bacterium]MDZ4389878.1 hypothetical protein [Gemmatimonadales bacterium]
MTDPKAQLDELITIYLNGGSTFDSFQRDYSRILIDDAVDADFSMDEIDYYGDVHEKAEWTAEDLLEEERAVGWIDESQFREWLQAHVRSR